ncbi:uncharacterized protein LOC136092286 [Hydra vulgaris]|uniref:Uncharacterized protein LOC136092286 n=1 Tax=Hydra vulgaris TaxID=6087 RepID=A0ABM4DNR2_HYDVU
MSDEHCFRQHPNDFVHGLLCLHVHQDSKEGDIVQFTPKNEKVDDQFDGADYNDQLKYWTTYKKYSYESSDNVNSILYVNNTAKQAVLAYCGVDVVESLKSWDGNLKKAILEVLKNKIDYHQVSSYLATKDAVNIANEHGYNLSLTGYSFGAWLAELSLYFCHMDFKCDVILGHVKSVTFNSPGSYQQMESYKSSIINQGTQTDVLAFTMVTYLSAPNLINVCHKHVGKVYRVFPETVDSNSVKRFKTRLPKWFKKKYSAIKGYFEALFVNTHYNLDLMLKTFDPKTGKPFVKQYREVLDWPCIEYKSNTSDYGPKAIKAIVDLIPGTFVIPASLKKAAIKAILTLIPDTVYGLLATVTAEFLGGNMKLTQLFETYEILDKNTADLVNHEEEIIKEKKKFSLKYKGHYRIDRDEVNLKKASIPKTKGTLEWYLKKLTKLDFTTSNLSEDVVNELLTIKNKYSLDLNSGNMIIISEDYTVEDLKDQMSYMLKKNTNIKKVLLGNMLEDTILKMQKDAKEWVKNCSPNNVMKEEGYKNRDLIKKTKKLANQITKLSKLSKDDIKEQFDKIEAEHLINSAYCINALANCYLYNNHDGEKAREVLLGSKKLIEQYVINISQAPFDFETLKKEEIYTELLTLKDFPEVYTITVYLLARTFLYHGKKADSIPYFELSKYLGKKLMLFEGYLSEGRGLGVVKRESLVEHDIENGEFEKAIEKLNEIIESYKELKSDYKEYKEGYKPGIGENKIVIPATDEYNQIDCSEQLTKCYLQLIRLTKDRDKCVKYANDFFELIGSDQSPGMLNLKKLDVILPKKKSSVRNTLGYTLLKLYDKDIDIKEFKILIDETNQTKDDLSFIEDIFNLAKEESRRGEFTKADAYDGLRMIYERKIKQKNFEKPKEEALLNLIFSCTTERDEINKELKRYVKYESSEVAVSDKQIQLEQPKFVLKKETTV